MCITNSEDGYVWFGLDFGSKNPGQVEFGSNELRQALRSNPKMIGTVVFRMIIACCNDLSVDEDELDLLVSEAYAEIGSWIERANSICKD